MFAKVAFLCRFGSLVLLIALSSTSWATGGGFFESPQSYNSGGVDANSMAVADLNGDGNLDLVVSNIEGAGCHGGGVGVLLGNGDGTFKTAQTYCTSGGGYSSIFVADLNNDGNPDLIIANEFFSVNDLDDGGIAVLLGNGDGTFQPAQSYKSGGGGAESVIVADLNSDGKPDVVVANCSKTGENCQDPPFGSPTGNVGVLLGKGDGTLQPVAEYDSGGLHAVVVLAADVNGKGELDLIVAHRCVSPADCGDGVVSILQGNGDGTFQPAVVCDNYHGERPSSMALADVNYDGKLDLLIGGIFTVGVSLGNGEGTFRDAVTYPTGGFIVNSIAFGDVNGDSVPDLLTGSRCARTFCIGGSVGVLRGNGDGTFEAFKAFPSYGEVAASIALADVNGDGRLDLLVADMCAHNVHCSSGAAVVFLNASRFRTTTNLSSSLNPSKYGQAVTFTATVTPSGPDPLRGRVRFWDGTRSLGAGNMSGGVATLTKSTLAIGTHSITAQYLGDSSNGKSTSSAVEQVVQ